MEADYRVHLANPAAMQQYRSHRRQTAAARRYRPKFLRFSRKA
jgi:hypothetical protein